MKSALIQSKRRFIALGMASILAATAPQAILAAEWPDQAINITVGYAPGGGTDFVIRSISPYLHKRLGQPVLITNKPGASAILAANTVAKAEPDGYNLFGSDGGALVLNGALFSELPYDSAKDFAPISMVIRAPLLVVAHPDFSPSNLQELIALSKKESLSYASVGKGAYHHLAAERL